MVYHSSIITNLYPLPSSFHILFVSFEAIPIQSSFTHLILNTWRSPSLINNLQRKQKQPNSKEIFQLDLIQQFFCVPAILWQILKTQFYLRSTLQQHLKVFREKMAFAIVLMKSVVTLVLTILRNSSVFKFSLAIDFIPLLLIGSVHICNYFNLKGNIYTSLLPNEFPIEQSIKYKFMRLIANFPSFSKKDPARVDFQIISLFASFCTLKNYSMMLSYTSSSVIPKNYILFPNLRPVVCQQLQRHFYTEGFSYYDVIIFYQVDSLSQLIRGSRI